MQAVFFTLRHMIFAIALFLPFNLVQAAGVSVGDDAPAFELKDQNGKSHKLSDFSDKVVVLEWTNPECPFVKRHYKAKTMTQLNKKYSGKDVVWLAVNSSHFNKMKDSQKWHKKHTINYPTLQDTSGKVGKAYGATTTPHMFVVDARGKVAYMGAIDDDPRGKSKSPKNYVDAAVGALVAGKDVAKAQTKPYGCSVKYKN